LNIAVNGKALGTVEKTGVARVALSLIRHIALLRQDFSLDIFIPHGAAEYDLPANVKVYHTGRKFSDNSFTRSFWEQTILPMHLRKNRGYDILLNLTNSAPVLLSPGVPQVLLVHDAGFRNRQWFSNFFSAYLTWVIASAAKHGVRFTTVSQTSAQELAVLLPGVAPALVVSNDSDEPPANLPAKKFAYRYGLFIGSLNPRKNISGAIAGFQKFIDTERVEVRLHIVGGESSIFATLPSARRECRNVVFQGYVDDMEKWALLKGAAFLLLPSFAEGFGLPVLEAMKVGTPVVASDIPVFRELFDNAVEYVDPHSPADIGRGIREVMENCEKRTRLIAAGSKIVERFSWKSAAQKYVQLLEEIVGRNGVRAESN
jgi:glycosyltransferase involved in cell wall biosynthesis